MLEEVKTYLKITWDDEDQNLIGIIARAKAYLNDLTGVSLDFESEGEAKSLLLDRCRYVYNNASEYFEENFQTATLRLQLQVGVMELGTDTETDEIE